jgi:nucleotide-binding universal stress UspA family protein
MGLHVLVPIDDSEPAWAALDCAANQLPADRITALHVVDPTEGDYYSDESTAEVRQRSETLREKARERMAEDGVLDGIGFGLETVDGKPAREIVSYAEKGDVDHIVMGSRGRSGLSRLLLGSVAETVVRRAPTPVTVVR